MSAVSEDTLIDAVNGADIPVGLVKRRDVFALHATFRVAHVLVFNSRDELLIQRLALNRNRHPGYWGSSVAAYLYPNESYEEAASRRMLDELGVRVAELREIGKILMADGEARKFIGIFISQEDGPFGLDHSHIDRVEFLPIEAILLMRRTGLRQFTPTFLRVLDFYLNESMLWRRPSS